MLTTNAQITIERGAIFHLEDNSIVSVQGDLSAWDIISGEGYLEMTGSRQAHIDMNGLRISNLVLRCPAVLQSDISIASRADIRGGTLNLNNHNIVLAEHAVITGNEYNYVQTTGTGTIKKTISGALYNYLVPIGTTTSYMPLAITTGTNYQHGAVTITVREGVNDHKPSQAAEYLKNYWTIQQEGHVENMKVTGYYRIADVEGTAANVSAFYWNGDSWKSQSNDDVAAGRLTAQVTSPAGELYGMNDMLNDIDSRIELLNNPVRSIAILQIHSAVDKKYNIVLRDLTGRQLQQLNIKVSKGVNRNTISIGEISQGIYFLDISSGTEKRSLQFVKVQ
jgi:hypothetical protein